MQHGKDSLERMSPMFYDNTYPDSKDLRIDILSTLIDVDPRVCAFWGSYV